MVSLGHNELIVIVGNHSFFFCHVKCAKIGQTWPFSIAIYFMVLCIIPPNFRLIAEILNSLAPGKFEWHFRYLIFQIISVTDGWGISCELSLRWISLDLTDDKSTLVQVMAWCRQATSHYLNQWWPRSLSPYGVTRPQWVEELERQRHPSDLVQAYHKKFQSSMKRASWHCASSHQISKFCETCKNWSRLKELEG